MNAIVSPSPAPMAHPPRSNPFLRSSSDAPPFPCITPSTVTCVMVINFIVAVPFPWAPLVGGLSPLLRTPLPPSDTTSRTSFEDLLGTPAVSDPTAGDDKIVGLHGATVMQQALPLGIDKWVEPSAA